MSDITPSRLRKGFGPIYRHITRCGSFMAATTKLVFLNIMEHIGQKDHAWPGQALIAAEVGISDRTVRSALVELDALGFINRTHRGRGLTDLYELDLDKVLEWVYGPQGFSDGLEDVSAQSGNGFRPERQILPVHTYEENPMKKPKQHAKEHRSDWKRYKRSDESNDDRPPGAPVERWLVKEMSDHFGAKIVQRQLERCELFFVWRKVKQYVDDGHKGTLKELLPQAHAEYQAEIDQIAPEPPATPHEEKTLAIYQDIEAKRQADYAAEYVAWEQETYPVVNGAQ